VFDRRRQRIAQAVGHELLPLRMFERHNADAATEFGENASVFLRNRRLVPPPVCRI